MNKSTFHDEANAAHSAPRSPYLIYFTQLIHFLTLIILSINIILLPIVHYRGYHPDFHTVTRFGALFLQGGDPYLGGNPYLPSSMLLWAPFSLTPMPLAWLIWKMIAAGCIIVTLLAVYRFVRGKTDALVACLTVLNLGILAGFTPKTGNPGNIAAPLAVLSAFLLFNNRDRLGGFILGISLSLKYPLGIPVLLFALIGQRFSFAARALSIFFIANLAALGWIGLNGHDITKVPQSLWGGVIHVGGFESSGFEAWFSKDTRGKYSTLSSSALLHTAGIPQGMVQPISLVLLAIVGCVSAMTTLKDRRLILPCLGLFCSGFLTFTYHRYYDSALLAFSIVTAWCVLGSSRSVLPDRLFAGLSIGVTVSLIRSVAYNLVYRARLPQQFYESVLYNFIVGPIHLYAVYVLMGFCLFCLFRKSASEAVLVGSDS